MPNTYDLDFVHLGIMGMSGFHNIFIYSIFAENVLKVSAKAVSYLDTEAARYLRMASEMIAKRYEQIASMSFYGPEKDGNHLCVDEKYYNFLFGISFATPEDEAVFMDAAYYPDDTSRDEAKKRLEDDLNEIFKGDWENIDGRIFYNLNRIYNTENHLSIHGFEDHLITVSQEQKEKIATFKNRSGTIAYLIRYVIELLHERLTGHGLSYFCMACGFQFPHDPSIKNCEACGTPIAQSTPWILGN